MLQNGYWAGSGECDGRTADFTCLPVFTLWLGSWAQIARAWVDAQGSAGRGDSSFRTPNLAKPALEIGEAPDWQRELYERREPYKIGSIPKAGLFVPCDVQKTGLKYPSGHGDAIRKTG